MSKIAVFGATSAIAKGIIRELAQRSEGDSTFFLVGRDAEHLRSIADDLRARDSEALAVDVNSITDIATQHDLIDQMIDYFGPPEITIVCYGTLPSNDVIKYDAEQLLENYQVNAVSQITLIANIARVMVPLNRGIIVAVTSVAGMRGRASNFAYGSAKSAVSKYLEGLRLDVFEKGVEILDIRPGLISTPMTLRMNQSGILWSEPESIAPVIAQRILKGKGGVLFIPFYWRFVMYLICSLPFFIMRRLKI